MILIAETMVYKMRIILLGIGMLRSGNALNTLEEHSRSGTRARTAFGGRPRTKITN